MIMIGMIFQFNADEGVGLIMLSDGQTKDFDTKDWVDETNEPSLGQEILYEMTDGVIKVKIPSPEEKNELKPTKKASKEQVQSFASIEEFKSHFEVKGFDVIKTTDEATENELSMGKFTDEGVQRVCISSVGESYELTRDLIALSNVDEHIEYFNSVGYKLINDFDADGVRMTLFRMYVMDKHSEIKMKSKDGEIVVVKTINGKEVN